MGNQQFLLIVLSVIIIGIAIAAGLQIQHVQAVSSHRQIMISRMNDLLFQAIAYWKTPAVQGGGGGSFVGFTPAGAVDSDHVASNSPGAVKLLEEDANYFIEWYFNDRLKIIASSKLFGEGNYWNNTYNARIVAVFDKNGNVDANGFQISGNW
ncbi:MAG: hypothetical protein K9N40_12060 [Candidatus Cloacimonetes bacterium]|nr:hypothetical protein [Candidatus Cloacimonadota bacterium]